MKILAVHNRYRWPGGEGMVFDAEAALLHQQGHEVVKYLEDNQRIDRMSCFVVAANTIWSHLSRQRLLQVLRKKRPDIAHFHNTFLLVSPAAYYACCQDSVPVVQTLHNYRLLCSAANFYRDEHVCEECLGKSFPWPGIFHACYHQSPAQTSVVFAMLTVHRCLRTWQKNVDVYIALTNFAREKFIEGGFPAEKVVVKPNFIYPDPGLREGGGNYALFVGRLSPEKGIRTLLRAWQLIEKVPLKIIGEGPLMDELKEFARLKKIKKVELLGWAAHEEVLDLMKGAQTLVFPSEWYEGFPMTIIEAFACGVPVLASRLGGMAEIVENERTGLHFMAGDWKDLAAKVDWAWDHPKKMQEMGREARREYEIKYTAEQNYQILRNIYNRVLTAHKI